MIQSKIADKQTDFLFKAVLQLRTMEECYAFFDDLCTVPEIKALSQRITVAKMLTENKVYNEISAATGASTATISRVKRSLKYGCDGYTEIFKRVEKEG